MTSRKNLISIDIDKRAVKEFKELPRAYQILAATAIDNLKTNPLAGEMMSGEFRQLRKLRVGMYRIVYTFKSERLLIMVIRIGHRKDVYRGLANRLK